MLAYGFAKTRHTVVSLFLLLAMGFLGTTALYAQVAGAMLKGTVSDASGAAVPKAQVSVIDVATGIAHNVTTDAA